MTWVSHIQVSPLNFSALTFTGPDSLIDPVYVTKSHHCSKKIRNKFQTNFWVMGFSWPMSAAFYFLRTSLGKRTPVVYISLAVWHCLSKSHQSKIIIQNNIQNINMTWKNIFSFAVINLLSFSFASHSYQLWSCLSFIKSIHWFRVCDSGRIIMFGCHQTTSINCLLHVCVGL